MHQMHIQQIPANVISGTYINSNIIVHHQKSKSTSQAATKKKHSAAQQRHTMNQTTNSFYTKPIGDNILSVSNAAGNAGLVPANFNSVNQIIGKKNSAVASTGH